MGNSLVAYSTVRTVFNGGHEETYGNATRLVPTQRECGQNQGVVPGEDGGRFDDRGDVCQGFLPKLLTKLSKGLTLCVSEVHPACALIAQNVVFRRWIGIA